MMTRTIRTLKKGLAIRLTPKTAGFNKICLVGLGCLAIASAPASANTTPSTSALEDARAILVASKTEQNLEFMFTQLVPVMESGFIGQISQIDGGSNILSKIESNYPGGQKAFAKRFGELVMTRLRKEYPNIIEQAAQEYVAEIPADDIAAIRAFMESRAGKSMAEAQPKIQAKLSLIGQEIGKKAGESAAMQLIGEAVKHIGNIK